MTDLRDLEILLGKILYVLESIQNELQWHKELTFAKEVMEELRKISSNTKK
jgi:hypothetical protein